MDSNRENLLVNDLMVFSVVNDRVGEAMSRVDQRWETVLLSMKVEVKAENWEGRDAETVMVPPGVESNTPLDFVHMLREMGLELGWKGYSIQPPSPLNPDLQGYDKVADELLGDITTSWTVIKRRHLLTTEEWMTDNGDDGIDEDDFIFR